MIAAEVAAFFEKAELEALTLRAAASVQPRYVNRASDIGDPCVRRLYYRRMNWRDERPVSPELQSIFAEGDFHEPDILARIRRAGVPLVELQRTIVDDELQLSGHIDAQVPGEPSLVAEAKSVDPNRWKRLLTHESFKGGSVLDRKQYAQNQAYQSMMGAGGGIIFNKNKASGMIRAIPIPRDDLEIATIGEKCRTVNAHVALGEPPPHTTDPTLCMGCTFLSICQPPHVGPIAATTVTLDSDLLREDVAIFHANRQAAEDFEDARERLKNAAKSAGSEYVGIGDVLFKVTEKSRKTYTVPAGTFREARLVEG